jgi:hypothetical protein
VPAIDMHGAHEIGRVDRCVSLSGAAGEP